MRRRTLLGLGAAVSGGLAFGTGAFTTVSAQRSVSIFTTSGGDAFLTLRPDEENGAFVETDGGTVRINFAEDGLGSGTLSPRDVPSAPPAATRRIGQSR